jgi:hypothetical protein
MSLRGLLEIRLESKQETEEKTNLGKEIMKAYSGNGELDHLAVRYFKNKRSSIANCGRFINKGHPEILSLVEIWQQSSTKVIPVQCQREQDAVMPASIPKTANSPEDEVLVL